MRTAVKLFQRNVMCVYRTVDGVTLQRTFEMDNTLKQNQMKIILENGKFNDFLFKNKLNKLILDF